MIRPESVLDFMRNFIPKCSVQLDEIEFTFHFYLYKEGLKGNQLAFGHLVENFLRPLSSDFSTLLD